MANSVMAGFLIDGSVLEGGGQILRNSVSLSALLSKPVSIHNIRKGRKPPGLKNQHRTGIELAAQICSAKVKGASNGSCAVDFHPGPISLPGNFTADPITAGSTTLLLQIALPTLLFSSGNLGPSVLTLRGGTNAAQAPQIDYAQHVLFPFLKKNFGIGEKLEIEVMRRGYFPRGGGEVRVCIPNGNAPLSAVHVVERGKVMRIGGKAHVGGLPGHLAEEMAEGAKRRLGKAGFGCSDAMIGAVDGTPIEIEAKRERNQDVLGGGSGIVLWAELEGGGIIGGSALGRKALPPIEVGEAAAEELVRGLDAGGCVDEYLQDQIIIFMALAKGKSSVRTGPLTLHTRTAIWIAEQLTDAKVEVEEEATGQCIIHCQGIGYTMDRSSVVLEMSRS